VHFTEDIAKPSPRPLNLSQKIVERLKGILVRSKVEPKLLKKKTKAIEIEDIEARVAEQERAAGTQKARQ
jgi:hypothetical protein